MKILRAVRIFGGALAVFAASATLAAAVEAEVTTWLNVRAGPGGGFAVITTLAPETLVTVTECQDNGWCHVEHSGPSGWVSSTYLGAPSAAGGNARADCTMRVIPGVAGPALALVCGDGSVTLPLAGAAPPGPPPPPVGDQACFYTDANFGGEESCLDLGTWNALEAHLRKAISSVKISGAARVRLCEGLNLAGPCFTLASDAAALPVAINDKTASLAVHTGPWLDLVPLPLPPVLPLLPVTYSTGLIDLNQSFSANFDNGSIGSAGADIWYQVVSPTEKYLAPRNGAQLAQGDGSDRGFAGCRVASFDAAPIALAAIPVGTYICVKTSDGRTAQFGLNGTAGPTLKLGYTTWTN